MKKKKLVDKAGGEGKMISHAERTVFFSSGAERHFVSAVVEWRVAHRKLDIEDSCSVGIIGFFRFICMRVWDMVLGIEKLVEVEGEFFWQG